MNSKDATTLCRVVGHIPSGVWALGFVSLLMDVSSELIHALLPRVRIRIRCAVCRPFIPIE